MHTQTVGKAFFAQLVNSIKHRTTAYGTIPVALVVIDLELWWRRVEDSVDDFCYLQKINTITTVGFHCGMIEDTKFI
ncbi:MAG: hypothetical protein HY252_16285 [Sphingobacteriales bacterium]|nr:hypothetical protein [Sphingobacteriales bacterium]